MTQSELYAKKAWLHNHPFHINIVLFNRTINEILDNVSTDDGHDPTPSEAHELTFNFMYQPRYTGVK